LERKIKIWERKKMEEKMEGLILCIKIAVPILMFILLSKTLGLGSTIIICIIVGIAIFSIPKIYDILTSGQQKKDKANDWLTAIEKNKNDDKIKEIERKKAESQYPYEFERKFDDTIRQCKSNKDNAEKVIQSCENASLLNQEKLWTALNEVSIPLQELEDIFTKLASTAKEEEK
jgi:hypothetical protein